MLGAACPSDEDSGSHQSAEADYEGESAAEEDVHPDFLGQEEGNEVSEQTHAEEGGPRFPHGRQPKGVVAMRTDEDAGILECDAATRAAVRHPTETRIRDY